ncbi:TlpA family protein disulfide reductase [Actinacidiphila acidipaludis]|uniref:Thioredoxin family protein n=1 Tax=Actinacidiphila acidipaludis TaxID=2873382 RepID=A0ABS7Q523_9ACTN|nr:thioredoxin family protein [Streptomyces acidipaludis]MBY8878258.1 thioredoxin family protein [Streptomyces acidipaludis]
MIDPTGLVVAAAVLAAATLFGLVRARRDGRLRDGGRGRGALRFSSGELGADLGERATLVQFSTALCATCPGTRRLLAGVAAATPGVRHVEIDAEARLDLVRRAEVMRTPTVLVLDPAGRVVRRASGPPSRADVMAAVELATAG